MVAEQNEAESTDVPSTPSKVDEDETDFPSEVESEIAQLVAGELEQIASDTGDLTASPVSPLVPPPVSPLVQGGIKGGPDLPDPEPLAIDPTPEADPSPEPESDAATAPPPPPKKVLPQPKIDFAALRRAKTADATNAKASVSRMFGEKAAAGATEAAPPTADAPATDPVQENLEEAGTARDGVAAAGLGRVRAMRERVRIGVEWIGRQDPELLRILGMIGLFFLLNGTLIFILALVGWI